MRFQYESRDRNGQWYRSYGTELWRSSINDVPIAESERRYLGARSASEYGQEIPLW